MIRLANNLAIPQGIPKDYLKRYVNWRVRNAFYDVVLDIYDSQDKSASDLMLGENFIIFPADTAEVFAMYEREHRDLWCENALVPASLPDEEEALEEWLRKPLAELMLIMNDEKGEDTPSLEGEYLMFHILSLAASLEKASEEEEEGFDTSGYVTKEIAEIALYNALGYLEEAEECNDEAVPQNADRLMELFKMYIKAMTELIEYAGEGSVDIYEALVWDWDYEILDLGRKIPEDPAYYMGIEQ